MELALVRALTWSTWERLRQQSADLHANCKEAIRRSQELRAHHRLLQQEQRTATLRLILRRKLRGGRLPRVWPLILSADPGAGGMCDACDRPLWPAQMVMTLRGRDPVVCLHADCFLLWDDIRGETTEAPERVAGGRPLPAERPFRTRFRVASPRATSRTGGLAMARMAYLQIAVALGFALGLLAGCEQKGTAEKAGEKMDKAIQKAGDKIQETGKEAEKKVKEATK